MKIIVRVEEDGFSAELTIDRPTSTKPLVSVKHAAGVLPVVAVAHVAVGISIADLLLRDSRIRTELGCADRVPGGGQ